jgi:exonuclease VII small subunit
MSSTGDDEWEISERIDRLEAIAETLEEGEVGLETAKELREEADEHLETLREELDVGDGEIIEMEAEAVDLDEE